jgi:hypothetical protein
VLTTFLEHAAATAAAERADARGSSKGATTAPKTVREQLELPPASTGLRLMPSHHRSAGFRPRELQFGGPVARDDRDGRADRRGGVLADGAKVDGPLRCANAILSRPMRSSPC